MIEDIVKELDKTIASLKQYVLEDIEDVKQANHEQLIVRNDQKLELMDKLQQDKEKLNQELTKLYKDGQDISVYKESIDNLEVGLRELYELNGKLASIVLPVKQMYKDIIDEITARNGGSLIEVMA
jgi:vacuolar-type H+-ATPase subunit I/STV1